MSVDITNFPNPDEIPTLWGAGLLEIVTTGMYDDPLSMYREYIQNAADAAAGSESIGKVKVEVSVDVPGRRVRIRDNGPGLGREAALERLLPIGRSDKKLGTDRGFRGVGRLVGLAFAKTVSFTTRSHASQPVTRITWHSDRLPEPTSTESELEQAILKCVDVETLPGSDYPDHFFDVEVGDVARHSAGLLLNRDAVRSYVGEVCPVPMSAEFPFSERVQRLFDDNEAPLTLEVILEGDGAPAVRPYGKSIRLSATRESDFSDFEVVRLRGVDNSCDAAVGWVAHSSYLGAIPRDHRVRGIRARVGNIQVGGETVFDHLFTEERFNRWCVGELHILDPRIIPNARRDYFQPGPHIRNLENQLNPVLREISTRCRRESTTRNRARKAVSLQCKIEDLCSLATSGYLSVEDSARLAQEALGEIEELRKSAGNCNLDNGILQKIDEAEDKLNGYSFETEPKRFCGLTPSEAMVYQKVFGALATLSPSPGSARELIEMVFAETSREWNSGPGIKADPKAGKGCHARLALDDADAVTSK